jgi:raffinose/stachyose/melibiose transport system permease protein
MWLGLLNPDPERGLINALLVLIPGVQAQPWLGNPQTVMICIFIVLTWKYFGFYLLLFMAGLQNIPADIEEAALIDGANKRQLLTQITIPLLGSTIRTAVYLCVLGSLQQFILVWIMTHGGPVRREYRAFFRQGSLSSSPISNKKIRTRQQLWLL